MILPALQYILRPIFGEFEREEFKKFLRMGLIFAFIIGAYWTLRAMKNSIFGDLILNTKFHLPWAKTASLLLLFPLVIIYTTLIERFSREKMFYILSGFYGAMTVLFGLLIYVAQAAPETIAARTGMEWYATVVLAYAWYVFVESFGSLVVALFWAFASDITQAESAKKGFYFVTAVGQIGGIIMPYCFSRIPYLFNFASHSTAPILFFVAFAVFGIGILVNYFLRVTPAHLLASFHGKNEKTEKKEQEPGFFEGLKLLLSHNYLLCIFAVITIYEIIVTIFDYNFQVLVSETFTGVEKNHYLNLYASSVNFVALACLLLGVSNITRYLGVGVALALMPIIVAGALLGFLNIGHLDFLFGLMVGSKAINYALNGPALKQLYIPTTHDVRYKSQAWIETFGSRGAKEAGSLMNFLLPIVGKAHYFAITGYAGFIMLIGWFFAALYLGRTYQKAVDEKRVVC